LGHPAVPLWNQLLVWLDSGKHKHNNGTDLKIGQVFLRLSTSMTFYYRNWRILLVYPLPVNTGVA
jgi:hypothetical protein